MLCALFGGLLALLSQPPDILHVDAIPFQHVGKFLWRDGDRPAHELRDVVAAHELPVIVGIGGRQFKRLAAMPFGVEMSDERPGERPVVAAAAENHPSPVARP